MGPLPIHHGAQNPGSRRRLEGTPASAPSPPPRPCPCPTPSPRAPTPNPPQQGFPTIKLFYAKPDGSVASGSSDYQGPRAARDIVNWGVDKARAYALKRLSGGGAGGGSAGSGSGSGGRQRASGGGGGGSDSGFYGGTDVVTLTDGNFDSEVVQGDEPYFVEFYAPW
jgi:hypothetical protein